MQDRYVGDVGDFGKYGLLRQLTGSFDNAPHLTLGVIWYKVPNEFHNNDGGKIHYLDPKNARAFEICDPELYTTLRALVSSGRRSLEDVARARILPTDTVFYDRVLSFQAKSNRVRRLADREQWIRDGLRSTKNCNVVFADPDNGLECRSVGPVNRLGPKYSFEHELRPIIERGQTLVAYHHTARQAPADAQIRWRLIAFTERFPHLREHILALRFRRGNSRAFLVVPSPVHRRLVWQRVDALIAGPWRQHFDVITLSAVSSHSGF